MRSAPVCLWAPHEGRREKVEHCLGVLLTRCDALVMAAVSTAQAGGPARISLGYAPDENGGLRITASVTDAAGARVRGVIVTFRAKTAFGWLKLAEVETGGDGEASFLLPAAQPYSEVVAQAEDVDGVRATLALPPVQRRVPEVRPGREVLRTLSPQPGLISPYPPMQILFVAALLAGVWTTYGYVVLLLTKLRAAR